MKALEKDRTRRYETAAGFAQDIQRHLHYEPVLAGPPSAVYKLRKFVRRNRNGVIAGASVAAALLLGLALSTLGSERGREDYRRVVEELSEERVSVAEAKARLAALGHPARPAPPSGTAIRRVWAYPGLNDVMSPSPDGRYLAFQDQRTGDLALRDLATGENRRLTKNKVAWARFTREARISPDGQRVAYDWGFPGEGFDLRVVGIDGSQPRVVYHHEEVRRAKPYGFC